MIKKVVCKVLVREGGGKGENRELMFVKCLLYSRNYAVCFSYIASFKFQNIMESGIKREIIREKH